MFQLYLQQYSQMWLISNGQITHQYQLVGLSDDYRAVLSLAQIHVAH